MDKMAVVNDRNYDVWGIALSTLCGVHCILTPLAILYFPRVGGHLESPWFHTVLIGLVAWVFHQSVYSHYKLHRSKVTLGAGLFGFAILLATYLFEVFAHSHEQGHGEGHHEEGLVVYLAVVGAVLLVTSHILNIRKCRCLDDKGLCLKTTEAE